MKYELITDACEGTPSEVAYLEHVQLTISLGFPRRGDLEISLISPSGKFVSCVRRHCVASCHLNCDVIKDLGTWRNREREIKRKREREKEETGRKRGRKRIRHHQFVTLSLTLKLENFQNPMILELEKIQEKGE